MSQRQKRQPPTGSNGCKGPLRECVRSAISDYFGHLDGHDPADLHEMFINEIESPLMESVMDYTGGNQTRAAEVLGLSRSTLRKKLKQHGIE